VIVVVALILKPNIESSQVLVLRRRKHQTIYFGSDIVIKILEVKGGTVRLGIEAPRSVNVYRGEVLDSIKKNGAKKPGLEPTNVTED